MAERPTRTAPNKATSIAASRAYIETVVGRGYRFVAPFVEVANGGSPSEQTISKGPQAGLAEEAVGVITLRRFAREIDGERSILCCDAYVSGVSVGRMQLAEPTERELCANICPVP